MTKVSVAQSLGLTSKRANRALAAFAAKYHIRENFAQRGKAQIKVCSLLRVKQAFAPHVSVVGKMLWGQIG